MKATEYRIVRGRTSDTIPVFGVSAFRERVNVVHNFNRIVCLSSTCSHECWRANCSPIHRNVPSEILAGCLRLLGGKKNFFDLYFVYTIFLRCTDFHYINMIDLGWCFLFQPQNLSIFSLPYTGFVWFRFSDFWWGLVVAGSTWLIQIKLFIIV